jgi:hypothetical protein
MPRTARPSSTGGDGTDVDMGRAIAPSSTVLGSRYETPAPACTRLAVLPRNAPSLLDTTSVAPGAGPMVLYDWAYLGIPWLPCVTRTSLTRRYRSPWPGGMTPWRARRSWRCLDAHLRRSIRVRN